MSSDCVVCHLPVRARQHGIACDECSSWTHRLCGTGISLSQYRNAVRSDADIPFVCVACVQPPLPTCESTRLSYESSIDPSQLGQFIVTMVDSPTSAINSSADLLSRNSTPISHSVTGTSIPGADSSGTAAPDTEPYAPCASAPAPSSLPDKSSTPADEDQDPGTTLYRLASSSSSSSDESFDGSDDEPADLSFDVTNSNFTEPSIVQENSITDDLPVNTSAIEHEGDTPVQFHIIQDGSEKGKPKLTDTRGYTYVLKRRLKKSTDWRCSLRNDHLTCPATVKQTGDSFVPGPRSHTHPSAPASFLYYQAKAIAKTDAFRSAADIVQEVVTSHGDPDLPADSRPHVTNLTRKVNRLRERSRPTHPTDLDFELNGNFVNDGFLQRDIRVGPARHLIFATGRQLDVLASSKTWFVDATFKVVRAPFYQLLSIHCFIRSGSEMKQVPLLFALMSRRKSKDYIAVSYMKSNGIHQFIRKLMSLPYLPPKHISSCFGKLRKSVPHSNVRLRRLFSYIQAYWMESNTFPLESWSVFGRRTRTNNNIEGWHSRLNKKARTPALHLYLLIDLLSQEARCLPMQLRLVSEKKVSMTKRPGTKRIQKEILQLWEDYSSHTITAIQLLRGVSRVVGPVIE